MKAVVEQRKRLQLDETLRWMNVSITHSAPLVMQASFRTLHIHYVLTEVDRLIKIKKN
jgi:hypothetical protein